MYNNHIIFDSPKLMCTFLLGLTDENRCSVLATLELPDGAMVGSQKIDGKIRKMYNLS